MDFKQKRILIVMSLMSLIGAFMCIWVIVFVVNHIQERQSQLAIHPSQRICSNLVENNLISISDCFITDDYSPIDYVAHYFPDEEVDEEYIRIGMQGIEIVSESSSRCETKKGICSSISYLVTDKLFVGEYFVFYFVDGELQFTGWQN